MSKSDNNDTQMVVNSSANIELKVRIIEATLNMFYIEGVKAVRMDDIASACGISKRTLYEVFTDREELIKQSLNYHVDKYKEIIESKLKNAENTIDEFWILLGHSAEFRDANKMVMKDLMKFYPNVFNEFIKIHHNYIVEDVKLRFERGQAEGVILKQVDTTLLARNLTSYMYGLQKEFVDLCCVDLEMHNELSTNSLKFAFMIFLRGASTEKGVKYIDEVVYKGLE